MSKASKPEIINLDDEDFFEMLEAIHKVIGLEAEIPDRIVLEWKDGSKMIFEYKNDQWYKIIEE